MMPTRRELLIGALPALLGASGARALTLTAADVHVDKYPTVEAVRFIGQRLEAGTGGRIGVRVYHSGQLGREGDSIDLVRFGAIDLTRVNFAPLNNAFPLTRVAALPYVFDSTEHMRRAVDGEAGRRILAGFEQRGLVGLAIYDSGARSIYNVRRPIVVPADLAGLKIRVPPSDVFIEFGRALGANPTPLAYGEVYSALQTHLIDGAENNIRSFHSSRQFEVARHWSETRHSYSPEALLIGKERLASLASADRELLREAARESVPFMRRLWDAAEATSRAAVLADGVKINEVDSAAFRRLTAPVLERHLQAPELRELYRSIRDVA